VNDRFRGIFTPLITPINPDESIDFSSLRRLVEFQIHAGVHGLWVMGTSAEFGAFSREERAETVRVVIDAARGRVPVIANVSDAATRLALAHTRDAVAAGADAVAATPPYYYPHSQDELLTHYRAIAAEADGRLFLYNIPQTVRVKVDLTTAKTLVAEGAVTGIKDSQNDLEWFRQLVLFVRREGTDFAAFAGTRHLIDAAVLAGADGAIPSVANAFPDLAVAVYGAASSGDFEAASRTQNVIVDIESSSTSVSGGSRNAQVLSVLKAFLMDRGVIDHRALTAPLRTITDEEWRSVRARIDDVVAATPRA
jgi:4-hydroxy-tetrahydrodipicolinate synthase